jgi:hypothetical protein
MPQQSLHRFRAESTSQCSHIHFCTKFHLISKQAMLTIRRRLISRTTRPSFACRISAQIKLLGGYTLGNISASFTSGKLQVLKLNVSAIMR